ncbi:Leucoanthocyanidin reductase, partial [Perkinsus chesapeaki]
MSSKTVAVVGATGVFGKEISLSLLKLGHKVVALTRSSNGKRYIVQNLARAGAK